MCVLVISHRMVHDCRTIVRTHPLRSSTSIVDPYACPKVCRCRQNAARDCEYHDCCTIRERFHHCDGRRQSCDLVEYHEYEQASPQPGESLHPLPAIDDYVGRLGECEVPWQSRAFRRTLNECLCLLNLLARAAEGFRRPTSCARQGHAWPCSRRIQYGPTLRVL